jgi:hypothetical protein
MTSAEVAVEPAKEAAVFASVVVAAADGWTRQRTQVICKQR